jgi:hypothetical protein
MRKKRLRRVGLGGFAAAMAGLAGLALFASPASAAGSPWTVVASPNPGAATTHVELRGVATVSPTEAWAVGSADLRSVIEHFNGTAWTITPNPHTGASDRLDAVAVTSATDAWAVGSSGDDNGGSRGLIEHWNGTAWSIVPSPVLTANDILNGIAARSATDAWAVGATDFNGTTLVEHWNGTSWTAVPAPSPGTLGNTLAGVTIIGANDAWAVGTATDLPDQAPRPRPLALYWNGTAWTEVAMPQPADFPNSVMAGVTGVASNDVWAVGNGVVSQLIEHWNGTAWTIVPSPSTSGVLLNGVTAVGHNDVWAVGNGNFFGSGKSFSERWNGTTWNTVPTPTGSQGGELDAVASLPSGLVWAVGGQINDRATFASKSLILRNTAG